MVTCVCVCVRVSVCVCPCVCVCVCVCVRAMKKRYWTRSQGCLGFQQLCVQIRTVSKANAAFEQASDAAHQEVFEVEDGDDGLGQDGGQLRHDGFLGGKCVCVCVCVCVCNVCVCVCWGGEGGGSAPFQAPHLVRRAAAALGAVRLGQELRCVCVCVRVCVCVCVCVWE